MYSRWAHEWTISTVTVNSLSMVNLSISLLFLFAAFYVIGWIIALVSYFITKPLSDKIDRCVLGTSRCYKLEEIVLSLSSDSTSRNLMVQKSAKRLGHACCLNFLMIGFFMYQIYDYNLSFLFIFLFLSFICLCLFFYAYERYLRILRSSAKRIFQSDRYNFYDTQQYFLTGIPIDRNDLLWMYLFFRIIGFSAIFGCSIFAFEIASTQSIIIWSIVCISIFYGIFRDQNITYALVHFNLYCRRRDSKLDQMSFIRRVFGITPFLIRRLFHYLSILLFYLIHGSHIDDYDWKGVHMNAIEAHARILRSAEQSYSTFNTGESRHRGH